MAPDMRDDETRLLDLLDRAIAARESGVEPDVDALSAGGPELAEQLRRALQAHAAIDRAIGAPSAPDPLLGRILEGRYELTRRIGAGAAGAVFAARDLRLQRHVGVKVLDPWIVCDKERRARFHREAITVASLRHPGIAAVHDHGGEEHPYVVMDLVPGLDLEALLDGGDRSAERALDAFRELEQREARDQASPYQLRELRPDPDAWTRPWAEIAASIVLDVGQALVHAHASGVLHRDVKPSNIRVRPDGRAVLLDFGLAWMTGAETLTRDTEIVGTLTYMAPEQIRGRGARVDARADVYGLGATLYRALTGVVPHAGAAASVVKQVLWDDPVPVRTLAPRTPRDLAAICHRAMGKRPGDRYPDAITMVFDLRAFLDRESVSVSLPGWPRRLFQRALRRPERSIAGLLAVVAIPLAVLAYDGREASAAARQHIAVLAARATVPALLTLEGNNPAYSVGPPSPRDPTGAGRAALDRVLRADPLDVSARLTRAMLAFDEGDRAAGLGDLRSLRTGTWTTGLATSLLDRLSVLELDAAGRWRRSLVEGLPSPRSALESYAMGYLSMRASQYEDARRFLEEALRQAPDCEAALDLLPLVLLTTGDFSAALDAAARLEGLSGRRTARSCYVAGIVQLGQERWREAVESFEQSLRVCPEQHGALQNLAVAQQQLGALDAALASVEHASRVRPDAVQTWRTRLRLLADLDRNEELSTLVATVESEIGGAAWWTQFELGAAELRAAIRVLGHAKDGSERVAVTAAFRTSADRLSRALELMADLPVLRERNEVTMWLQLAEALAEGERTQAVDRMLLALGGESRDAGTLQDVAMLCRQEPGSSGMAIHLLAEAHALAPEDRRVTTDLIEALVTHGGRPFLERAALVWQTSLSDRADAIADSLRSRLVGAVAAEPGFDEVTRAKLIAGLRFADSMPRGEK